MSPVFLLIALIACRTPEKTDDTAALPDDTGPSVVDGDGDGYPADEDCNDADASIHPGAEEVCDGVDNDCDEEVDEELESTWYADADGDGWGDELESTEACEPGDGWVDRPGDCDDTDSSVNPGAEESCNDQDDDCDGGVDEELESTWYADADSDGYGDPRLSVFDCEPGTGWVADASDCDDANSDIHPAATERCDGVDDDCDGLSDDADSPVEGTTSWYLDADGDGYGDEAIATQACDQPSGHAAQAGDCDDADPAYNPGASEADCTDPADYNCDGSTGYADEDGDGWAACEECDDGDPAIHPGGTERCDGADNDCDGDIDEDDAVDTTTWYQDADGDGYGDAANSAEACSEPSGFTSDSGDCDDGDAAVSPGATEACDGVDNDCDGLVDDDDSGVAGTTSWYADADGDGYGSASYTTRACSQPSGYVADGSDCDDTEPAAWPGNDESCDGVDNDCDGSVDEADAVDAGTWYLDGDGDGWGADGASTEACSQPSGTVAEGGDCDDAEPAVHPGATESCNGIDDDCDGSVDEEPSDGDTWYTDADGDGYGDPGTARTTCSQPSGTVADATDCHDDDDSAYPGSTATELPFDGVDQDCDGEDRCSDLNCDGIPDLLFPSYRSDSTWETPSRVYYGTGYGFASSHGTSLDAVGPLAALVEDLDGDGYQDIVLGGYYDGTTRLVDTHLYWGSASGYSSSDLSLLATEGVIAIEAADLDGDGYIDLVFGSHYGTSYSSTSMIYWGSAAGYDDADRTELQTYGVYDLAIADLDQDGYDELIFAQYRSDGSFAVGSYVYWGSAAGYSGSDLTTLPMAGALAVLAEDLNGDGWLDLAFACYYSGSSYGTYSYVYWGSSTGPDSTNYDALYTYGSRNLAAVDADGDGHTDLVFSSYY
jgi:hypothetical protein